MRLRKIGDVAKVQSGFAFKSNTFVSSGVRLLRNTNILPQKIYWDESAFIADAEYARYDQYQLCAGDVLLSLDRPVISSGFKVAQVREEDLPALLVQRVGRFIINKSELLADYLYAFLQTPAFIQKVVGHDQSLGVPHISPGQVEDVQIPLPDIDEQKELIARTKAQLAEVETARAAVTAQLRDVQALTDAIYRGAFPRLDEASIANSEFQLKKIGAVAETTSGTTPSRSVRKYWQPGTVPWVKTGEIVFEVIRNTEEAVSDVAVRECSLPLLPIGTVLIAMYGQGKTRGQSAILDIEATTNQACFAILPNDTFSPQYLQYWLQASYHSLRQLSEGRGGNQANLNGEMLRELSVPWVVRPEQEKIVEKLRRELAEVAAIRKALELKNSEINLLPQKILSAAFEM